MWISPEFKIYIVKEFQRLKADEQKMIGWSAKRELAKNKLQDTYRCYKKQSDTGSTYNCTDICNIRR